MQEIGKFKINITVIPNNLEKYMAFFLGNNLKFIDSCCRYTCYFRP